MLRLRSIASKALPLFQARQLRWSQHSTSRHPSVFSTYVPTPVPQQRHYTENHDGVSTEDKLDPEQGTDDKISKIKKNTKAAVQRIELKDEDIEEKHVRGWGNGGQKLNKTSSCVQLHHKPTGVVVICQDTRQLQQNRKIARKRLKEKIDLLVNGENSKIGKKVGKIKERKRKRRQRAKKKYGTAKEPIDTDDVAV